jgi:hypothetical protein
MILVAISCCKSIPRIWQNMLGIKFETNYNAIHDVSSDNIYANGSCSTFSGFWALAIARLRGDCQINEE